MVDGKRSPLHERHEAFGAKFAEFGGWTMPLEYSSGVVKEHTAVREAVGIFDVSHLGKAMVSGPGAADYVNATLTNDLRKVGHGKAQYTLCCDAETGGIVDDLIAYFHTDERVLLVPNAANTAEVVRRLVASAPEGVTVPDHHDDYAVLAVQGTGSDEVLEAVGLPTGHDYMSFVEAQLPGGDDGIGVVVCRTGYTGERGYELIAAQRRGGDPLGRADGGRCRPRPAALRARRARHAAHRDGLPAARPGHLARRHPQPGPARVGRRLGQGRLLGPRRAAAREGGRAGAHPARHRRHRPRDPAAAHGWSA